MCENQKDIMEKLKVYAQEEATTKINSAQLQINELTRSVSNEN